MAVVYNQFRLKIEIYRKSKNTGIVFENKDGNGLISYEYNHALSISGGSFSFTFKDLDNTLDKLDVLDVVRIYEHDKLVFIGIITDISISASAQNGKPQKTVSVSGKSVEYLFDMLQISLDISALAVAGKAVDSKVMNISLVTELSSEGTKAVSIKEGLNSAFENFKGAITSYKGVSSTQILDLIGDIYGSTTFRDISDCGDIQFKYPLSSNLYKDRTVKFLDLLRTLLPTPVYEIFGRIRDNEPKIIVRECPFRPTDWTKLNSFHVPPELLTAYSIQRSCEEVYTEFMTYVEGANLSPEFYRKIYATENGNAQGYATKYSGKRDVYGYRPLEVTFSGFYSGKNDDEVTQLNDSLNDAMAAMDELLCDWFGRLDEMYKGAITFVNTDVDKAGIGERAVIGGSNEFYVTAERHSWNCVGFPTVTYSVDRGGKYSDGNFNKCEKISDFLAEWEK